MLHEKAIPDYSWPLYGMAPRIIRLRRNVSELEQRLTDLEQCAKPDDLAQLYPAPDEQLAEEVILDASKESLDFGYSSDKENLQNGDFNANTIISKNKSKRNGSSSNSNSPKKNNPALLEMNGRNREVRTDSKTQQKKQSRSKRTSPNNASQSPKNKKKQNIQDNAVDTSITEISNQMKQENKPKDTPSSKTVMKPSDQKNEEVQLKRDIITIKSSQQNSPSKSKKKSKNSEKEESAIISDKVTKPLSTKSKPHKQNSQNKSSVTKKVETKKTTKSDKKVKKIIRYFIDCELPASDGVFDTNAFKQFLNDRFKVQGKTHNLGNNVTIDINKSKISITTVDVHFSKRYLKYLTKKYLAKTGMRDFVRVVAPSECGGDTYQLRYYKYLQEGEDDSSDGEE